MEIFENQQHAKKVHWYLYFPTHQKQPLILSFIRMTRRLWVVWCDICKGQVIKIFLIDTSHPLSILPRLSQPLFLEFFLQNVDQQCVGTDWEGNTGLTDTFYSSSRCWSLPPVPTDARRGVRALVSLGTIRILFPVGLWQFVESVSNLLWQH